MKKLASVKAVLPKTSVHRPNHPHLHRAKMSATGKSAFPPAPTMAFAPSGNPQPTQAFDAPGVA